MKMQRGGGRAVNELIYGEFEQMRRIVVLLAEDEELLRMVSAEALGTKDLKSWRPNTPKLH